MTDASAIPSEDTPDPGESTDQTAGPAGSPAADAAPSSAVDNSGDNAGDPVDDTVNRAPVQQDSTEAAEDAPSSARRLEEEGDIAADYVEELLDISDLDGDIDIEVRNGRTYVSVIAAEGDDRLRDLVGREGKGLEALQELARLAVLSATGIRSRLVLDIAGHRADRSTQLEGIAQEAIDSVRGDGEPVHLKPMGAYERKVVHDVIAEAGLVSASEGEGPRRHVVVSAGE
ncbi:RNA-binding protein [Cellulosimicrobium funkei]|nr:RNA-binding protein [Cellulosimicrobium funkei]